MTLRASTNPARGGGHFPGSRENLEPGKETSAHGYESHAAAAVGLLAPERPEVCGAALTGVRA
jgi:hypothetical protein